MSFSAINMLWLFWVVPMMLLVCLWGVHKRKSILRGYATPKGLSAISPHISGSKRWLKMILLLVAMLLMVVSLAGPQYGYSWKEIERRGVDLIVVLDCSRSMLAEDIKPNRLERAKREVFDLLGMIQGDRVGLVALAGTAFLQCPLTLDYEGFYLFLNALNPDFLPVGGTDLAGGVSTALSAFNKEDATDKAIILITDGETTGEDPLVASRRAAEAGIKLFCIGVGAGSGVPIPAGGGGFVKDRSGNIVLSKLDESTLKEMAAVTTGAYVRSVAGDMDLDVIYHRHIRGTMETSELGEQKAKVFENRYQWVLALSVFLLFLEFLVPVKKMISVWIVVMLVVCPRPAAASDLKQALEKGQAAYDTADFEMAVQHFVAAQLEAPEKDEIAYDLGNSRYKTGDYDGAIQAYQQVLHSDNTSLKQKALYNMGNAFFRKSDLDKAIGNYEAALSLDRTDTQAQENLDFVKTLRDSPPPESSEGQQNKENRDDQESGEDRKQSGDQGKDETGQERKDDQSRQQANEGDNDPKKDDDRQPPLSDQNEPPEPQPSSETQEQAAEKDDESRLDEETLRQAEKMLNRLQDQPGRAMIPAYRDKQVEKDW